MDHLCFISIQKFPRNKEHTFGAPFTWAVLDFTQGGLLRDSITADLVLVSREGNSQSWHDLGKLCRFIVALDWASVGDDDVIILA